MIQDPRRLLRESARLTATLSAIAAALGAVWKGAPLAYGILVGAAVGWLNLWLLARALTRAMDRAGLYRGRAWALPLLVMLKWPLVFLLLLLALRYTPARAEGVVIGFTLSLLASSVAALRGPKQPPDSTPDDHPVA